MKKYILGCFLLLPCSVLAQSKWTPLQLDLNFVSWGLQTTYKVHPRIHMQAGVGLGTGVVADYNQIYYMQHTVHKGLTRDIFLFGFLFVAPYAQIGVKYLFLDKPISGNKLYARYHFKAFGPQLTFNENVGIEANYRNTLMLGVSNYLNKNRTWQVAFELGAGLWHNYDFCHIGAGPKINLQLTYDLL